MKPYVLCYMMSSLNGRIDCAMTELIDGSDEYYEILNDLNLDCVINGKKTAVMHYAKNDKYKCLSNNSINKKVYYKAKDAKTYTVICDTLGSLTWEVNEIDNTHLIIALSEKVSSEYLDYLKNMGISYIVTGSDNIDLKDLLNTLGRVFNIKRVGVLGGGLINGAFLKEKLLDEICILIGPGIDGRSNQPNLFDGLDKDSNPINLNLTDYKVYKDGSVYLTYIVK